MSYGQQPPLSSMTQDWAAPDTDLHPLLLPGSFLMWTGEGPAHRQRQQVVRAPLKAPSSHLWAGQGASSLRSSQP